MNSHSRRSTPVAARLTAALAASAALAGCAAGGTGAGAPPPENPAVRTITVGTARDSAGPAPAVPGAKRGGTVNVLDRDDFAHLDPGRVYVNYFSSVSMLFTRKLTAYRHDPSGRITLVGDLATDPGVTSDGGRTWRFTLKEGVRWEDGAPVTSADVKHSFERLFADFITEGPTYAQQWLVPDPNRPFREQYRGPYEGRGLDTIETPDDRTIVFHLNGPHPDFNFTLAMTGYGAVPKAHDTRQKYDRRPFSSGPYKIVSHITDKSMDLQRNPYWDERTDPIRHAYPDRFHLEFGVQAQQATERFLADTGDDRRAFTFHNAVAPERVREVLADPEAMQRSVRGVTPYTGYYVINTSRIRDVNVRKAIITAWPSEQILRLRGGEVSAGRIATTVLNPSVIGYRPFDLYGKLRAPQGDPEAARRLLARSSDPHPTVVYAYNQLPSEERVAVAIERALTKAGFTVVTKPLNPATYFDAIGRVDNPYDLYWSSWAADWPTGATVIRPQFDGRLIADGAPNYSHLNVPEINQAIDRAGAIGDREAAGRAWAAIDRMIMEQAAVVPERHLAYFGLHGSGLGGIRMDPLLGEQSALDVWVK